MGVHVANNVPRKGPEAFVDKPDLADLLTQLVREEFGYVLPEKPEEPHLSARIDAVMDALTEVAGRGERARGGTVPAQTR
jgi:hypothetical protein